MLKILNVNELQPGMMITKVVSQHGPVKVRKVGIIRGQEMIKGLTGMGVTEVEVDLNQSFSLLDDVPQAAVKTARKLTPTQQLLRNERQTASQNTYESQQFNHSLFMPSTETLPSFWTLYGKNIALLIFLMVGGLSIGWSIASAPKWLSLIPNNTIASSNTSLVDADQPLANEVEKEVIPLIADNEESINKIETASSENMLRAEMSDQLQKESSQALPEEQAEPLVLGYQPENSTRSLNPIRLSDTQSQNLLAEPQKDKQAPVSSELIEKINQAIAELEGEPNSDVASAQTESFEDLPRIDQLSIATQTELPTMTFSAHMYSSDRDSRWVRVNGRRLIEGDYIAENLQLVNIEPQIVILMFKDELFTMNAMTDW